MIRHARGWPAVFTWISLRSGAELLVWLLQEGNKSSKETIHKMYLVNLRLIVFEVTLGGGDLDEKTDFLCFWAS